MARRKASKPADTIGKFAPGLHTLELPELFSTLRRNSVKDSYAIGRASDDWNGNMDYFEALNAAQYGAWDAPQIESISLPDVQGIAEDTRYNYDVTGSTLDIAAYLSGEPEYWLTEETTMKPCGRVIRLAVEIGGQSSVSAHSMANRGQAIVALINSLELSGHSVELTIVRAYRNSRGQEYQFLLPVKHAGQSIDMKRIQFMIGHPAFYRRCLFGMSEIAHAEQLLACATGTRNYVPDGYKHISAYEGLEFTIEASLQWAEQFARRMDEPQPLATTYHEA